MLNYFGQRNQLLNIIFSPLYCFGTIMKRAMPLVIPSAISNSRAFLLFAPSMLDLDIYWFHFNGFLAFFITLFPFEQALIFWAFCILQNTHCLQPANTTEPRKSGSIQGHIFQVPQGLPMIPDISNLKQRKDVRKKDRLMDLSRVISSAYLDFQGTDMSDLHWAKPSAATKSSLWRRKELILFSNDKAVSKWNCCKWH